MDKDTILSIILNWLGIIEFILLFVFIIISVWIDSEVVRNLICSDIVAIIGTWFIYFICCYEKKENK